MTGIVSMSWLTLYRKNHHFNYLQMLSALARKIILQLTSCDLCGQACHKNSLLCEHCYQNLPKFYYHKVQGDLLNWPEIYHNLPNIHFDHLIALAPHISPYQTWLNQLKYHHRFELAQLLGKLLATNYQNLYQQFKLPRPDLVICVPIHIKRWQVRGFNQSHLLSQQFINALNASMQLPYAPNLVERISNTPKQVGKTGSERRSSLKHAFTLTTKDKLPNHVMLIDDVLTTGATTSEISYLLKQQGVQKVTVLTVTISLLTRLNFG